MSSHWWPRLRACTKCGLTFTGVNARCNRCAALEHELDLTHLTTDEKEDLEDFLISTTEEE